MKFPDETGQNREEPSLSEIKQVLREYESWSREISDALTALQKEYREIGEAVYSYTALGKRNELGTGRRQGFGDPVPGIVLYKEDELLACRTELESAMQELESKRRRIRRIHLAFLLLPREEQQILKALYIDRMTWKSLPQEFGMTKKNLLDLRDRAVMHIRERFLKGTERSSLVNLAAEKSLTTSESGLSADGETQNEETKQNGISELIPR